MPIVRSHHSFDDHYTQIPNAWVRDPRISFKARGVLTLIMSHRSGWSISVQSLARENQEGKDSIRSAIRELEEVGYLKRSQVNENGRFGEAIWVTHDPDAPLAELPMAENPTTENPTPKKNILKEEHVKEQIHAQAKAERERVDAQTFDQFWENYPRKVGKGAAWKAFVKVAQNVSALTIIEGARRLSEDPNLPAQQFIPYPATWLNRDGWLDEPYPERELSPEERAERERQQREAKRLAELEASRRLREEADRAREELEKNPPKRCEHDRIIYVCKICSRNNVSPTE